MMKKILLSVLVVSVVWGFGVGVCVAEKPELKLTFSNWTAPPSPPGGGEDLSDQKAAGYRDPELWKAALAKALANGADNQHAYATAVYNRLAADAQAALESTRGLAAIEACPTCNPSGLVEADDGWIRCRHQGARP